MISSSKRKKYIPSAFLVIISIMLLFIISSWIGRAISSDIHGIGLLDIFSSIWHGFSSKVDVILFIFAIGGTLGVLTKLKVIDAGINALVHKLSNKSWLLIPILMFLFGLGGTTYGMWEETIAFIPVLILIFKKTNHGPFTAILVVLLGAGTGCLASTINPFAVGAAVDAINTDKLIVAKVTTGVLQGTRWVSFIIFEAIAISFVTWLASRYKKGILGKFQTDSAAILASGNSKNKFVNFFTRARVVDGIDNNLIEKRFKQSDDIEFTTKRKISLILFILGFVLMIIMYLPWRDWLNLSSAIKTYDEHMWWFASTTSAGYAPIGQWYFISVASIFLLITIIIFAINFTEFKSEDSNSENTFIDSYMSGIKDVVSVCMIIAFAGGLSFVLEATGFGPLIASEASKGLTSFIAFSIVIFLVSIFLSLLIPSTSGFAAAFMPIFAKIAIIAFPSNYETAIGLAILGFLFANGLANFVTPTSAALMGYTAYVGVPYNVWIKQTWKYTLICFVLSFILIITFAAIASGGSQLF